METQFQQQLKLIGDEVYFDIQSGSCDFFTGLFVRDGQSVGETNERRAWKKITCCLSSQMLEPLLNPDISDSMIFFYFDQQFLYI